MTPLTYLPLSIRSITWNNDTTTFAYLSTFDSLVLDKILHPLEISTVINLLSSFIAWDKIYPESRNICASHKPCVHNAASLEYSDNAETNNYGYSINDGDYDRVILPLVSLKQCIILFVILINFNLVQLWYSTNKLWKLPHPARFSTRVFFRAETVPKST